MSSLITAMMSEVSIIRSLHMPPMLNIKILYDNQQGVLIRFIILITRVFLIPRETVETILATIANMLIQPCHESAPTTKNIIPKII